MNCSICGRHYDEVEAMLSEREFCSCGGGLVSRDDDDVDYDCFD